MFKCILLLNTNLTYFEFIMNPRVCGSQTPLPSASLCHGPCLTSHQETIHLGSQILGLSVLRSTWRD